MDDHASAKIPGWGDYLFLFKTHPDPAELLHVVVVEFDVPLTLLNSNYRKSVDNFKKNVLKKHPDWKFGVLEVGSEYGLDSIIHRLRPPGYNPSKVEYRRLSEFSQAGVAHK